MSIAVKLHAQAYVEVIGFKGPQVVTADPDQPNRFRVLGYAYRKDGTPLKSNPAAPKIALVYSRGCRLSSTD